MYLQGWKIRKTQLAVLSLQIFICFLAADFTATSIGAQTVAQEDDARAVIHVWKVGSPHRGDVPEARVPQDLQARAAQLGCRIEMRSMAARDLSGLLTHALATNDEPEVLVIDNMGDCILDK